MAEDQRNTFIMLSGATLAIPAVVSFFKQPLIFPIVLSVATGMSLMYHHNEEQKFEDLDQIWASFTMLIGALGFLLIMKQYGTFHWRTVGIVLTGIAALVLFFQQDYRETDVVKRDGNYELYHALWHTFASASILIIVMTPIRWSDLSSNFFDVVKDGSKRRMFVPQQ